MSKESIIHRFLIQHGFKWTHDETEEDGTEIAANYLKEDLFAVEVSEEEIVFLDDSGDFLHIPNNIYALVGALVTFRAITTNFSIPK